MTDKEFERQKKRVEKILDEWRAILGLNSDRLRYHFNREYEEGMVGAVASVNASWQYKNHRIDFYVPKVKEIESDNELTEAVIHELVHILIHSATGDNTGKSDAEVEKIEYATTSVTYALLWAREAGQRDKK